jgi:hypothetical protein
MSTGASDERSAFPPRTTTESDNGKGQRENWQGRWFAYRRHGGYDLVGDQGMHSRRGVPIVEKQELIRDGTLGVGLANRIRQAGRIDVGESEGRRICQKFVGERKEVRRNRVYAQAGEPPEQQSIEL